MELKITSPLAPILHISETFHLVRREKDYSLSWLSTVDRIWTQSLSLQQTECMHACGHRHSDHEKNIANKAIPY